MRGAPRILYVVTHEYSIKDGEYWWVDFPRTLGVYSTAELANEAFERYQSLPGFDGNVAPAEPGDGLVIGEYALDHMAWDEGFVTIPVDETEEES